MAKEIIHYIMDKYIQDNFQEIFKMVIQNLIFGMKYLTLMLYVAYVYKHINNYNNKV